MGSKFTFTRVKKQIERNVYMIGVKKNKDNRRKVTHKKSSLKTGARGSYSGKTRKPSGVSNSDVCKTLRKDYKFDILRDPFNPKKYNQKMGKDTQTFNNHQATRAKKTG